MSNPSEVLDGFLQFAGSSSNLTSEKSKQSLDQIISSLCWRDQVK